MVKILFNVTLADGVDTDQPRKAYEVVRPTDVAEGCYHFGHGPFINKDQDVRFPSPVITPSPGESIRLSLDEAIEYERKYGASVADHLILDI